LNFDWHSNAVNAIEGKFDIQNSTIQRFNISL